MIADLALAAGSLALAGAVLRARRAFTAVAFFIAHGLLLALAWARLGLMDVALTEAAIGAGLSGVLLLAAARATPADPLADDALVSPVPLSRGLPINWSNKTFLEGRLLLFRVFPHTQPC